MPRMTVPTKPTCIQCGTGITAITHRLNDGFCMVCCDPFPAIRGTKHLLDVVSEAEVDSELAASGVNTAATFHRWLRIKSRMEPGDRLVRFRSDLQSPVPVVAHGVVWRRGGLELSGVVTLTEWLLVEEEMWLGNAVRFATAAEIAACLAVRDEVRAGDQVLHYRNDDPEGIAVDGRAGLVLVRNRRCALRVRIERKRSVRGPHRDFAQLDLAFAELCRT